MLLTIDTNILVYAFDDRDLFKQRAANQLLRRCAELPCAIGTQVIGELFTVLVRKRKMPVALAREVAEKFIQAWPVFSADAGSTLRALSFAASGQLSFWDANLLSAGEAAGCTQIFSEDMADGFRLGRLEIVNPFAEGGLSFRASELLSL